MKQAVAPANQLIPMDGPKKTTMDGPKKTTFKDTQDESGNSDDEFNLQMAYAKKLKTRRKSRKEIKSTGGNIEEVEKEER